MKFPSKPQNYNIGWHRKLTVKQKIVSRGLEKATTSSSSSLLSNFCMLFGRITILSTSPSWGSTARTPLQPPIRNCTAHGGRSYPADFLRFWLCSIAFVCDCNKAHNNNNYYYFLKLLFRPPGIFVGELMFYRDSSFFLLSFFLFRFLVSYTPSSLNGTQRKSVTLSKVSAIWKRMSEIWDIPYKSGAQNTFFFDAFATQRQL